MVVTKQKNLFICTGNSCRSQMAEGWTRHLHGDRFDVWSAGIETHGLNPSAVQVMLEAGVDISGHHFKLVEELPEIVFDLVITAVGMPMSIVHCFLVVPKLFIMVLLILPDWLKDLLVRKRSLMNIGKFVRRYVCLFVSYERIQL